MGKLWLTLILVLFVFAVPSAAFAEVVQIDVQRVDFKIEYPVGQGPTNVAWESPGRAWFTAPERDMIGVIVRNSNASDELISVSITYLALANGSRPYDIAYADNTVWFTEFGAGKLGRIDLSGATIPTEPTKEYSLPTKGSQPSGVAVDPDGMVWIVSANRAKLTKFDPASETFTDYNYASRVIAGRTVSTKTNYPDIAVRDSSRIWLTVPGSDIVLVYKTDDDDWSRILLGNDMEPSSITLDSTSDGKIPGGYPWVTCYKSNLVARYAPDTLAGWRFTVIPTPNSGLRGIAIQDNGDTWDIWFSEQNAGKIGRLTVTPKLENVAFIELAQSPDSRPFGITVGNDESIWFAESGRRTVSELRPPYASIWRLPVVFSSQQ